jgi:hypothetical protein
MLRFLGTYAAALAIIGLSTILTSVPNLKAQTTACTTTNSAVMSEKIANGHSWGKHKNEFVAGTMMAGFAMPSSPKVTTLTEFKALIQSVMGSTITKALSAGRKAYWGSPTGTIVVYDPNNVDCGTAFRPIDGKPYYDRQN